MSGPEPSWEVRCGDALAVLRGMPDESVQTCVTSPPYWGLRDYGHDGQIGLEETPEAYVARLVEVFGEVRRVLREDGTLWLNLGDSYAGSWGAQGRTGQMADRSVISARQIEAHPQKASRTGSIPEGSGLKPKDLVGIPWRVAFALQADGWWLRSAIVWHKPNPMPESVQDRPTSAYEHVFLLSRSERYFYDADAIREPHSEVSLARAERNRFGGKFDGADPAEHGSLKMGNNYGPDGDPDKVCHPNGRNARNVWTITTKPFTGWIKTSRQVPAEAGDASGDTRRTPSEGCPVHASLDRLHPTLECDARAAWNGYRNPDTGVRRDPEQLRDYAPTALSRVLDSWDGSSDSPRPSCSPSASDRSNQNRRTGHDPETSPPCTPSSQSDPRTESTSASRDPGGPAPRTDESSISAGDCGGSPSTRNRRGNAGMSGERVRIEASFGEALRAAGCVCSFYTVETQDVSHFAVFPPELAERCILAGTSQEGACPECGAPWERVVDTEGQKPGRDRNVGGRTDGRARPAQWENDENPTTRTTTGWKPICDHHIGSIEASHRCATPTPCTVLDPFAGAGTTGLVALRLRRSFVGIELSEDYATMARRRIRSDAPLFHAGWEIAS